MRGRPPPPRSQITGVILAGGAGRRMGGGDKGLQPFLGRPLIDWVIRALAPQVSELVINANRNLPAYAARGYPVVADGIQGFAGPLAGIAAVLPSVATPWIACVPCDGPCLAPDLVERLCLALCAEPAAELAVASDGARLQLVHALIPVILWPSLQAYLAEGRRAVGGWYARHRVAVADLSDRPLAFANLNTEADREALALRLATAAAQPC